MTASETVGKAIASLRYADLSSAAIHAAERSLLDTVGAMLVGSQTEESAAILRAARRWGSLGPARVWGAEERYPAPEAALINGTAAHAREVDDFGGCGHSGAVVVPAALAAASMTRCSGSALLTAIVAGYEVAVRVTDALGGYRLHNAAGWHATGTAGSFGAAAAASYLLNLDAKQTAWAIGLTGSYTGGIWAFIADGAMSKRLHAGKAAETGLVAACLAREGFSGPLALFEEDQWGSFLSLYGSEPLHKEALLIGLDKPWEGILRSGFKPYACCRGIHGAFEAALAIREGSSIGAEDVDRIVVRGSKQTVRQLGKGDVRTMLDAQFSIPYSLALAFLYGQASLEEFEDPVLHDPLVREFAKRVSVVHDPTIELGEQPVVGVWSRDGRRIEECIEHPKGDAENPMSDKELERKFYSLGSRALDERALKELASAIWRLDEVEEIPQILT